MAGSKKVKVTYKPPQGEVWVREFPEAQAAKMVKMGRWKYAKPSNEAK